MPERGGPTTQSGILYQNSVAALYLGRLCDAAPRPAADRVVGVRVEAPERVDDTVVAFADDHRTFIQAKEQIRANEAAWDKLWRDFAAQFLAPGFRRGRDRLLLHIGEPRDEHHDLREVCERTRGGGGHKEWWGRLTQEQRRLVNGIEPLLPSELLSDNGLPAFFGHIDVEFASLRQIERDFLPHWMPPSDGTRHALFRLLRDRVGGEARRRGAFTADALRSQLAAEDGVRLAAPPDLAALRETVARCGAMLRAYQHTIASTGRHVRRTIVDDIVAWAGQVSGEGRVAMLLDGAGMGKTVAMRDTLVALEDGGSVVLAIKADQQLSGVADHDDLQRRLGLPDAIERVVALLAAHGPVVVLVDQIDALSLSLARDQRTLDVVLELVARLRSISGVRLLLTCRTFDRNTDPKLKRIAIDRVFTLAPFEDAEVAEILHGVGVDHGALSPATRELLRVPLHLDLFARVAEERQREPGARTDLGAIGSLQELYALLWRDVVRRADPDAPPVAEREAVLRVLTERMDRERRTTVPQAIFAAPETARLLPAANWLASMGVLIAGASEWTFLHQTFFDYCYARHFVERGGRLSEAVLAGDQGLFARPQIAQVLAYQRANDPRAYLRELQALLGAGGLRFHLRDLLLRWFGALPSPTDEEWTVARRLLLDPARRARLLAAMHGNVGWFARLQGRPLQDLLALDDQSLDATVMPYLLSLVEVAQAEVARLVAPLLERGDRWRNRVAWLLAYVREWRAVEAVDLFERLLRSTPAPDPVRMHALEEIARTHPEVGCRLVRLLLDRALDAFLAQYGPAVARPIVPFGSELDLPGDRVLGEALDAARQRAPRFVVDSILPWLKRVVALADDDEDSEVEPYFGYDLLSQSWRSGVLDAGAGVTLAFTAALTELARREPAEFRAVATRLAALPYETPQYLLARIYRAVPDAYADEAAQFLLGDRRRLALGEKEQYDSRQLLAAIYPYLSEGRRAELEAYILDYAPIRKYRGVQGLRWWRIEQLYFLQAVPQALLTARGVERLQELERKFPGMRASESPSLIEGGFVVPPISVESVDRMSDAAWLRAMRKYRGAVTHREFLKGGADQLATVLSSLVKEQPERFHRLALRLPGDTDEAYVRAFLNGLADSAAPADRLFDVARRFADHPGRTIRRTTAWALEKRAASGLPDDLADLLEGWVRARCGDEELGDREPFSRYLNSDRGASLRALMRALDQRGTAGARERQWALLEFVAADSSPALRAGAIEEALYLLHTDRARAVGLFERLLDGPPELLAGDLTRAFIYHGLYRFYRRMRPFIRALMAHGDEQLAQRGAELACIAAVSPRALDVAEDMEDARQMAEETVTGPARWRRGAARVYAENLVGDETSAAVAGLLRLLGDDDREVRRFIGGAFGGLGDEHIVALRPFLEAYAASPALHDGTDRFAEYLWEYGPLDPAWALSVVETVLGNQPGAAVGDGFSGGEELIRLVLRVHNDSIADDRLRARAMDAFDRLMERFTGDAQRALGEWDRR